MISSIDLKLVNRMNQQKMLFGDGTCEVCGDEDIRLNMGGINYCWICYTNRVDNSFPDDKGVQP